MADRGRSHHSAQSGGRQQDRLSRAIAVLPGRSDPVGVRNAAYQQSARAKPNRVVTDGARGVRNHGTESLVLTRLTKQALGTYLAAWGSDLPTRRHAQESRPNSAKDAACSPSSSSSRSPVPIDKLALRAAWSVRPGA